MRSNKGKHCLWDCSGLYFISQAYQPYSPSLKGLEFTEQRLAPYLSDHTSLTGRTSALLHSSQRNRSGENSQATSSQCMWSLGSAVQCVIPKFSSAVSWPSPHSATHTCISQCVCVFLLEARPTGLYSCHSCQSRLELPTSTHPPLPPPPPPSAPPPWCPTIWAPVSCNHGNRDNRMTACMSGPLPCYLWRHLPHSFDVSLMGIC